ncbi:MAG: nitric-oxide reductase large subunit [Desulfurococcales archaeon]|nr:nitric-oxide reductase large subunit [Desulfurococcales archaeon]
MVNVREVLNNNWSRLVLAMSIIVYIFYFAAAAYTFLNLPPIPDKVVTEDGRLLFTADDIVEGKYLSQKYGLYDYGAFLGFGGYFGPDYTAYTLEIIARTAGGVAKLSPEGGSEDLKALLDPRLVERGGEKVVIVSDAFAKGYERAVEYWYTMLSQRSEELGLKPNLITDKGVVEKIVAYWTWGVIIALMGYTNGFPYKPGILEANVHVLQGTWITFIILLLATMPIAGYVIVKFIDYWREPRVEIQLPPPTRAQKIALIGMALAVLGLSVQGLLGGYLMHKYSEQTTLYGIEGVNSVLPFNVARALHFNLAILWIVVTWISFALFMLPYLGYRLSERQVTVILGLGAIVALALLFGIWIHYLKPLPDPWWYLIGSQGRPFINQGIVYLILIGLLGFMLSYMLRKASTTAPGPVAPLVKIVSIGVAGMSLGAIVAALPIYKPWAHFTMDEYFRWITIHSFVEGFWPAIVIPLLLALMVVRGLVPPKLAVAVAGMDASLEIATGMIGTAHHYYWGGQPTFWLYLGAVASTLEVIPIGFLIAYAVVLWLRGQVKTELDKTIVTFVLVAAFGGAIGVVVFGAGMINMPIINYYLHGSQGTMVHAHLAMPLAYGVPTMLFWVVSFYLAGLIDDGKLRLLRKAVVVLAIGFYLQYLLSLGPLMVKQYTAELDTGYWYIRSLVTPDGAPGFWDEPSVERFIWLRMIGDVVAALGILAFLVVMWSAVPRLLRELRG